MREAFSSWAGVRTRNFPSQVVRRRRFAEPMVRPNRGRISFFRFPVSSKTLLLNRRGGLVATDLILLSTSSAVFCNLTASICEPRHVFNVPDGNKFLSGRRVQAGRLVQVGHRVQVRAVRCGSR